MIDQKKSMSDQKKAGHYQMKNSHDLSPPDLSKIAGNVLGQMIEIAPSRSRIYSEQTQFTKIAFNAYITPFIPALSEQLTDYSLQKDG